MNKIAVVLFNLGGPDNLQAVQPFLFNLFNDHAIIRLPQPFRFLLAKFISSRRVEKASGIYAKLGGASPLLKNTERQARALEGALKLGGGDFRCFVSMRYWHPFVEEVAQQVKDYAPDKIILLPLYPQFSTTTTASSLKSWEDIAKKIDLRVRTKTVCCYPTEAGFVGAMVHGIRAAYEQAKAHGHPRILFSAHGLPESIVKAGDPYPEQCHMTAEAIVQMLNIEKLDWALCYQSRVGRLKWIGPSTEDEIKRAGITKTPLIAVPLSFVSENSETLYEIDMLFRDLARDCGVPFFAYVPTAGDAPDFMAGLAALIRKAIAQEKDCVSGQGQRICPQEFSGCCQNYKVESYEKI